MPQPLTPGGVNAPRLRVLAGKTAIEGTQSWSVTSTNNRQASQFSAQFALMPGSKFSANWWSGQSQIRLTLQAGMADAAGNVSGWTTLLVGDCDTVDIDMGIGVVHVAGRDLTSLFIDNKIIDTYQNQTSSQIASILASAAGLTPNVAVTKTLVGRYYRADHTNTSLGQFTDASTQWDLLVYLAEQEGFDVWVDGTTLNFQPPLASPTVVKLPYIQGNIPQFGGVSLTLSRAMTLAKDVEVQVRSWNSSQKKSFVVTARGSIKTNAGGVVNLGPPQTYLFIKPDLTFSQAQVFAQQKLTEISRHERTITVVMPGDLTTNSRDMVRLSGTGTAFDQSYYIDTIDRKISIDQGFTQTFTLKNHSPSEEQQAQNQNSTGTDGSADNADSGDDQ